MHPYLIQGIALVGSLLILWGANALVINKHHDRSLRKLRVYRP